MSNAWNTTVDEIPEWDEVDEYVDTDREVKCHRCHGTGEDRDGADCMFCDGFGTMLV